MKKTLTIIALLLIGGQAWQTYAEYWAAWGDFAGKGPTNGTFSIGAYQYQAKGSNFPALPIWDSFVRHSKSTDAGSYVQPE